MRQAPCTAQTPMGRFLPNLGTALQNHADGQTRRLGGRLCRKPRANALRSAPGCHIDVTGRASHEPLR